ncbi:MAG: AbrB/MazE/SpoVT family DNA-binding domain-containing protein [Ignavibacteriales bacterium]
MTAATAKMTSKGQITVPEAVREHPSIGAEDRVALILDGDRVFLEKLPGNVSALQVFGVLHRPGAPTVELGVARAKTRAQRAWRYRRGDEEP